MPILEIITLCRRCRHEDKTEAWRLPTRIPKLYKYSLVSLSVYLRPRRGAERIRQGEGRWNLPPKTALERSDLTEKFRFRESDTEAQTKTNPDQFVSLQKEGSFYRLYM